MLVLSHFSIFNSIDVTELLQSVQPTLPSSYVTLYDAHGPSNYAYIGTPDYINYLLDTNPIVANWTSPTILPDSQGIYTNYVCNDPIYQDALIYTQDIINIIDIIAELNLITYIVDIFSSTVSEITEIFLGNINYNNFNAVQFIVSLYLAQLKMYNLPGLNSDVTTLLSEDFQVQVFNNTDDAAELYNLADSSRISGNIPLINSLLTILNQYVVYNNCQQVWISLPGNLLFTQLYVQLKNYMLDDVPRIYNYSLLEGNNFNKTNGS